MASRLWLSSAKTSMESSAPCHSRVYGRDDGGDDDHVHGPELQRMVTENGVLELSIFETAVHLAFA